MKLVLVKSVKHGYENVVEVEENGFLTLDFYVSDGRIPISEIVEVDFPLLDKSETIASEVAVIDKQITKVVADSEAALTALEGKKQQLLSITHEGA